jgi:hypothetical protein
VPAPVSLVDAGVAPSEQRKRTDEKQEEEQCDFHARIIVERYY